MFSPTPEFSLKAITSGRTINRATCAGRPLLLLFHNQHGIETVRALQNAVRTRWPLAQTLLVGSVVSLQGVPRLVHGVAEAMLGAAYRDAARELPVELDPADYILILLDGAGKVSASLGIHDGGKQPTALVIDGAWQCYGPFTGADLVAQSVACLGTLLTGAPADARRDSLPSTPSGTIGPAA